MALSDALIHVILLHQLLESAIMSPLLALLEFLEEVLLQLSLVPESFSVTSFHGVFFVTESTEYH